MVVLTLLGAWVLRGFYDQVFLYEGLIHLSTHSSTAQIIELAYPSGKTQTIELSGNGSATFFMPNGHGEGSIAVTVEGEFLGDYGYITTLNQPINLSICQQSVQFSYMAAGTLDK